MPDGKRGAAAACRSEVAHPLLQPPHECIHQLSEEGEARATDDPDLAPGHDCCAVCAELSEEPVLCTGCESVQYCSAQHLEEDAPAHSLVCATLRLMRNADALLEASPPSAAGDADGSPDADPSGGDREPTPGTVSAAPHRGTGPSAAGFAAPVGAAHGWQHVVPRRFLRVCPCEEGEAEGGGGGAAAGSQQQEEGERAGGRPSKKRRGAGQASGRDGHAPDNGTSTFKPQLQPSAAPAAAPNTSTSSAEEDLLLAASLAEITSTLTYAYTAASAVAAVPAAAAAAASCAAAGRPMGLVVLGAAAGAELADLPSWQAVAAALGADVRLTFVGPEVPDELAGGEAAHGRVRMRFEQATYDEVLERRAGGAGGSSAIAAERSSPAPAPPRVFLAFNPGFTCPDYSWDATLDALAGSARGPAGRRRAAAGAAGPLHRPTQTASQEVYLVVATNTVAEAQMEMELLVERGWVPAGPVRANPYPSLQLLQSGTLANDLYRKNAWLVVYRYGSTARRGRKGAGGGVRGAARGMARALYGAVKAAKKRLLGR